MAVLVLLGTGCVSGTTASPINVGPRLLWTNPASFQDKLVCSRGTVRVFYEGQPGEHFVLEESTQYRVGLQGTDRQTLLSLVGETAAVTGRFRFRENTGGYIQVKTIQPGQRC